MNKSRHHSLTDTLTHTHRHTQTHTSHTSIQSELVFSLPFYFPSFLAYKKDLWSALLPSHSFSSIFSLSIHLHTLVTLSPNSPLPAPLFLAAPVVPLLQLFVIVTLSLSLFFSKKENFLVRIAHRSRFISNERLRLLRLSSFSTFPSFSSLFSIRPPLSPLPLLTSPPSVAPLIHKNAGT